MYKKTKIKFFVAKFLYFLGFYERAFVFLAQLKASGSALKNIDLYRARIRLKEKKYGEASQMLYEELRLHNKNRNAEKLLKKIKGNIKQTKKNKQGEWKSLFERIEPYSMLSESRLRNLFEHAKEICLSEIPGNFVECGVAAGGSSALLAWVIKKYSKTRRRLFSFDTFCGMPPSSFLDTHKGLQAEKTGWGQGTCNAPVSSLYKIADELEVRSFIYPVIGFFEETLPLNKKKIGKIALIHLDGDWFQSTKTILENLFDQTCKGAHLQIDDYGYWEGCKKAVDEFFLKKNIPLSFKKIDDTGIFFKKK